MGEIKYEMISWAGQTIRTPPNFLIFIFLWIPTPKCGQGPWLASNQQNKTKAKGCVGYMSMWLHYIRFVGTDLVFLRLSIHLPTQRTLVWSLGLGRSHNSWGNSAHEPQLLSLCSSLCSTVRGATAWEACAPQLEKTTCSNEDPVQPKLNKLKNIFTTHQHELATGI